MNAWTFIILICASSLSAAECGPETADEVVRVLQTPTLQECTVAGAAAMLWVDMGGTTGKQVLTRCVQDFWRVDGRDA